MQNTLSKCHLASKQSESETTSDLPSVGDKIRRMFFSSSSVADLAENNNFDFFRLIAALLVIFAHCYALLGKHCEPLVVATHGKENLGQLGVCFFFTISGFLVTRSWIKQPQIFTYISSRALRLLPALFFSTLFSILVIGPLATDLSLRQYLQNPQTVSYLSNALVFPLRDGLPHVFSNNPLPNAVNGSLWTLPVESYMYIAVLLLGCLGIFKRGIILVVLAGGLLTLDLCYCSLPAQAERPFLGLWVGPATKCTMYFLAGMLFYLYRKVIILRTPVALAAITVFFSSFSNEHFRQICFLVLPYVFFYLSSLKIPMLKQITKHGDISYGLYVFSFPLTQLLVELLGSNQKVYSLFFLVLVLSTIMASISWKFVESPALKLKKRFWARGTNQGLHNATSQKELLPSRSEDLYLLPK